MINIERRLNIFIDESGDSIKEELKYLNEKLAKLGYDGMIHLAYLVAKRVKIQVLTVIDKLDYKRKNNIAFTKNEEYFFIGKDFRNIINLLKEKRIQTHK